MRNFIFKLCIFFLALTSLLTCTLPPYDEGLSLGIETARKMLDLGAEHVKVGPINAWDFDLRDREFFFIPNKNNAFPILDNFKSGFVATVDEKSFGLSYVEFMPPDFYNLHLGWGSGITNEDPDSLNYHTETVKWGPFLSFIRFDRSNYKNNRYYLIDWPGGGLSVRAEHHLRSLIHGFFGGDPNKNPTILGSSIWPMPTPVDDLQVFFCRYDGNGRFAEVSYETDTGSGLINPAIINDDVVFSFPDEIENAFYFHNWNTLVSYLSYYSKTQRKYKNYRWGPGPPLLDLLIQMDRRIDAVLSTGQLLSFENNRCYVYDAAGNEEFDFLVGSLHFCYEIEWGGLFYSVFTLPAWLGLWDYEDELHFNVYLLPSDQLNQLQ